MIMPLSVFCLTSFGCLTDSQAFENVMESKPSVAIISENNSCMLSETIHFDLGPEVAIKLPPDTDIKSIRILSEGKEIKNKVIEKKTKLEAVDVEQKVNGELVITKKENEITECYYLRVTSKLPVKSGFTLEYMVSGISWQPSLTATIADDQALLIFNALVTNTSLDLNNTDILLVSSPYKNISETEKNRSFHYDKHNIDQRPDKYAPIPPAPLSKRDQVIYKAGHLSIVNDKNSTTLVNIDTASATTLRHIYLWQTDDEFVRDILFVKNPFPFTICNTVNTIIHNGSVIDMYQTDWTAPGGDMVLYEDTEKNIQCESSVEVVEDLEKKNRYHSRNVREPGDELYYNHSYEFSCFTASDSKKDLHVVFKKKYGRWSKSIYHFEQEPKESPSWWHIWETELTKRRPYILKFNIDSDVETFQEYKKYKRALEGC